ncbi:unnamed protein product [Rodentolepis nana]|uniref:Uncharacterized protein n=1 Tax=Rodentolepis nana TaxID=102285 RepID=A0A0R3TTZ7_RODNA|nr:unnamed protein product [Rodentolepis nana]
MAKPKCHDVSSTTLLAPPLTEAFDELRLSTVSLLANASSNPSGQCSHGSLEQFTDSPRTTSAVSPNPYFRQSSDGINYLPNRQKYGSCSLLTEIANYESSLNAHDNSNRCNIHTLKRLRHNSASSKFAIYHEEHKPLKFNTEAPDNSFPIAHPKPCYVLHVNVVNTNPDITKLD